MESGAVADHPAPAHPAKERTRVDPGGAHPGPQTTGGGSAHEEHRADAFGVRLGVLEGEPSRPVLLQRQVLRPKGGGFTGPAANHRT